MKYTFKILAVLNGSIGDRKKYTVTVEANSQEEAKLKLYDTHEHIFIYSINGKKYSYL